MPNINTIAYQQAGPNQNNIAALTNAVAGTTETAISLLPNAFTLLGGGVVPLAVPGTSVPLTFSATVPSIWTQARPIRLRAFGTVTTGGITNVTIKLYEVPFAVFQAGTQGTLANDNLLNSSGTFAVNNTSANWELTAELVWDPTSQRLTGTAKWNVNGALVAEAAITTVTPLAADSGLLFLLSGQFSAAFAANSLQVQWFEIEQV